MVLIIAGQQQLNLNIKRNNLYFKNTRGRPKKQPILIEPENIEEDDPFETYSDDSSQHDNEFLRDFDNEHYKEPDDIIEKKTPKTKQTKN